ncbi:hypothetical protein BH09ACT7_BH09ACT7_53350 [soil metagenome]
MRFTNVIASAAVVGGLTAGALGLGAAAAYAEPAPVPLPPAGPDAGQPPAWAPPKPVPPLWANGAPQVWDEGWQHWGVWLNGVFVPTY